MVCDVWKAKKRERHNTCVSVHKERRGCSLVFVEKRAHDEKTRTNDRKNERHPPSLVFGVWGELSCGVE